jgi:hypothetical protein
MTKDEVHALIAAGGIPYAEARPLIKSGDLLFLHDEFVLSWYGAQIEAVQLFTGPFAHVAMFEWVTIGSRQRLLVAESVVDKVRAVAVSATAGKGFIWQPMNREPSDEEHTAVADALGFGTYSKPGATEAGLNALPASEDADPRQWCAKRVVQWRRKSGLDLAPPRHAGDPGRYVPTDVQQVASALVGLPPVYVLMQ